VQEDAKAKDMRQVYTIDDRVPSNMRFTKPNFINNWVNHSWASAEG
jgi:hypothetical protein